MSDDTKPLLQDATTSDDLRHLLDAASAHEPSPPDLARLSARLSGALPPGTLPAPPTTAAPAASAAAGAAGKVGAALLVLAVAGGAAWLSSSSGSPSVVADQASTAAPIAPAPIESAPSPPAANVEPEPSASASAVVPHARPTVSAPVTAPPEATLLARAHAELLRGAAAEALATTTEHARAYPHGMLAQERDVIAIEALIALGRREDARRRAAAFRMEYPGSSHAARIGRLLEEP